MCVNCPHRERYKFDLNWKYSVIKFKMCHFLFLYISEVDIVGLITRV